MLPECQVIPVLGYFGHQANLGYLGPSTLIQSL